MKSRLGPGASALLALVVLNFAILNGCGKKEEESKEGSAQATPAPPQEQDTPDANPQPQPQPQPQPKPPKPPAPPRPPEPTPPQPEPPRPGLGSPAWGQSPERRVWAGAVLGVVRGRMGELERARDLEVFCPGYRQASLAQRQNCWLLLVAAIAKFESAFKPATSFREPDGNYSVGLLALSPGECPNAPTMKALMVAVPNLVCGVNKMAHLIGKHGYIDGPADGRGASRYWSTLRAPYKRWDPTRNRWLNLGKRNLILPLVRGFRGRAQPFVSLREQQHAEELFGSIVEMPVELDGFGYHQEE